MVPQKETEADLYSLSNTMLVVTGGVLLPFHYIIKPMTSCYDETVDNLKTNASEMRAVSYMIIEPALHQSPRMKTVKFM